MISGLEYIPNYISEEEERRLLDLIDQQVWLNDLRRRVQHYGYKYDYKSREIKAEHKIGEIPGWLSSLGKELQLAEHFKEIPEQVIVNEYLPGQGIAPHIDSDTFGEVVASLSLGSDCQMDFSSKKSVEKKPFFLRVRSLMVLSREARYNWQHSIAPRKSDIVNGEKHHRQRRVSLTFRTIKK